MASTEPRSRLRGAITAHLASRLVSRVLYGSIVGLALIVALEHHAPGAGTVAITLLATAVAVGLAELFSEIVGAETRTRAAVKGPQLVEMLEGIGAVAVGITFPAVFFVLAALDLFGSDTAFAIAKWTGLGLIFGYGFAAARLTGDTLLGSLRRASLAALIGGFLVAVKALLH